MIFLAVRYHHRTCFSIGLKGLVYCLFGLIKPVLSRCLRLTFLRVADVAYGLLFSPCVNVNEIQECAVCYGS